MSSYWDKVTDDFSNQPDKKAEPVKPLNGSKRNNQQAQQPKGTTGYEDTEKVIYQVMDEFWSSVNEPDPSKAIGGKSEGKINQMESK